MILDDQHDHPSHRTLLITLLERLRSRGLYGPSIAVGSIAPVSDQQLLRLIIELLRRLLDDGIEPEPKPDEKRTTHRLPTPTPISMPPPILSPSLPRPSLWGAGPRSPAR